MASKNLTEPFLRCNAYNFLLQKAPRMQPGDVILYTYMYIGKPLGGRGSAECPLPQNPTQYYKQWRSLFVSLGFLA